MHEGIQVHRNCTRQHPRSVRQTTQAHIRIRLCASRNCQIFPAEISNNVTFLHFTPRFPMLFSNLRCSYLCVHVSMSSKGPVVLWFFFFRNPSTEGGQWGKPLLLIPRPKGHDTVSRLLGFPLSPHPFTVLNTWGDLVNRAFSFEPGGTGLTR